MMNMEFRCCLRLVFDRGRIQSVSEIKKVTFEEAGIRV